jgi:hypothetical protein
LIVDSTQTTGMKWAPSAQSTLSAKGSLVTASGANTLAELTVGADGTTLVANSSASTGVAWQGQFMAGKNKIINGDFGVWQRSNGTTTGTITAATSGATTAYVVSNSFVVGQFVTVTGMTPTTLNGAGVVTVASGAGFTIAATTSGTFSAGGTATGLAYFSNPLFYQYLADRWRNNNYDNAPTTYSFSQQTFTAGAAPITGYEGTYFARSLITTVGTNTQYDTFNQRVEEVRVFAGQTATLSFWAKSDSTRVQQLSVVQNFGSGGSTEVTVNGYGTNNFTTTTSWQRFTFTLSFPSISGKTIGTGSFIWFAIRQASASGSQLDLWGVQLEAGSVATPFTTATGTVQGELAACQRYYNRWTSVGASSAYAALLPSVGSADSSTQMSFTIGYPPMRTNPSLTSSGSFLITSGVVGNSVSGGLGAFHFTNQSCLIVATTSGLTAGYSGYLRANSNNTAYIDLIAEL